MNGFQLPEGEVTVENLVREELGLFETRDSAGNEYGTKSLWLFAVALETGMCLGDESLAIDLELLCLFVYFCEIYLLAQERTASIQASFEDIISDAFLSPN